jgi:hypothetical protein
MPRYYFHIQDRLGRIADETGIALDGAAQAYDYAIDSIRSIVADDARRGVLSLGGFIDISDDIGHLIRVPCAQACAAPTTAGHGERAEADNDNGEFAARAGDRPVGR